MKTTIIDIVHSKECGFNKCKCSSVMRKESLSTLDFLGYRFEFHQRPYPNQKASRDVMVYISKKKINKIKTRIIQSIFSYYKDKNFGLLRDRVRFLSTSRHLVGLGSEGGLMSGLRYSYPLLTEEGVRDLMEIDRFYRKALTSKNGSFGRRVSASISFSQASDLMKISFYAGYKHKLSSGFSMAKISQIKEIW